MLRASLVPATVVTGITHTVLIGAQQATSVAWVVTGCIQHKHYGCRRLQSGWAAADECMVAGCIRFVISQADGDSG